MAKKKVTPEQVEAAERQLKELQRQVEYDTKDYTLELLLDKFEKGDFYIPDYQRQFVWKPNNRSLFIEYVLLGLPTTGLHFEDIRVLLGVLNKLVDKGNTIIVIEHNLDVIKSADYLIDMGPEGGRRGGNVLFTGTPEALAKSGVGFTAPFLKEELDIANKKK